MALTALVAVSGTALSVVAAAEIAAGQRRVADQQLDRRARQAQEAVTAEAGRYVDTLRTVAAAAGSFNELTAEKFDGFTAPLASMRLAGVSSIAYVVPATDAQIPAVQAFWRGRGARDLVLNRKGTSAEHLFSVLGTSLDGSAGAGAGIDVSQAPAPTAALNESRRSGQPAVSDAYRLLRDAHLPERQRQMSFLLAAPVYGLNSGPGGEAFRGWVVMGLRGQDFAAATLQRVSQQLLDIHLSALNSAQEQVTVAELTAPVAGRRDTSRDLSFPVADRRWELHVAAHGRSLPGAGSGMPATVAVGGGTVSVLLAALVAVLATGRRRARAQVEAATAGLAAAELEARDHADLLDAILNSISEGVGVVDRQGAFILHNAAAKTMLGSAEDRGGPENWQKFYGMFQSDGVTPFPVAEMPLVRALDGVSSDGVEMIIRNAERPDGLTIAVSGRPLRNRDGATVGAVAVFHDITAQRAAQAQLAENAEALRQELRRRADIEADLRRARDELDTERAFLAQVLDALEPIVLTCDTEGVIVHANRAARAVVPTTAGPMTAAERGRARRYTHPDGTPVEPADLPLMRSLRGEQVTGMELITHAADGTPKIAMVHSRPLRHADGHITGAVSSVYDITELRERENELRAFAGVVAHDLKSPLASISGYAELIEQDMSDGVPADELRPQMDRIRHNVDRMRTLIDDLLAYATARDAPLDAQPVDLADVVADVIHERTAHLRTAGPDAGAVLFPDIYVGPLPVVQADRGMIRQLLDNLIGNALKYTPPGQPARIDISAHRRDGDDHWTITIADRGIGIPPADQAHVFDSFHRAAAHRGYQGTGLGLAICERIVTRHGGVIAATDNPGGGTRFTVTLPAAAPVPATISAE